MQNFKKNHKNKNIQDYEVISSIENGVFNMCFKVQNKLTKIPYIWRGIKYDDAWSDEKQEDFMNEINMLQQLQHPYILQHYDYLFNYESKCIFIVMEYMENDNLEQLIVRAGNENKRISEYFIWRVLQQICEALQIYENNKIKQNKSDVKIHLTTKNVLLDLERNIIKLTDFGLNNIMEKHETETITSIGYLIYELCTLHSYQDLTPEICNKNYGKLWHMYSQDLRELVNFMLQDNKRKNNIGKIFEHPLAIIHFTNSLQSNKNISYPCLLPCDEPKTEDLTLQDENPSIMFSEHNSILVEYEDKKFLNIDNVFTPDLRAELFYSARRRVFPHSNSDGQLYESICQEDENIKQWQSPSKLTNNIFDKILLERLHAIRVHERLLAIKEHELNEKERRLYNLQNELELRKIQLNMKEEELLKEKKNQLENNKLLPLPPLPPPIPPRKNNYSHDDTYCSIDQDSPTQQPRTIAKLNLAALKAPKRFPTLRKVTFQSPKKFISYNIDTTKALPTPKITNHNIEDVGHSSDNSATNKRKSILSIFGLSRSNKDVSTSTSTSTKNLKPLSNFVPFVEQQKPQQQQHHNSNIMEGQILAKCETSILNNMWTKEHKRAAFDMLAAMNSAGTTTENITSTTTTTTAMPNKMRQSIREKSNSLQRHRLQRRSMITNKTTTTKKRDNLII